MSDRRGYSLTPLRRDRDEDVRDIVDSRYNSRVRLNEHLLSSVGSTRAVIPASVTGGIPPSVKDSDDWRLRTDASEATIISSEEQRERFINLVGVRAAMLQPFRWPIHRDTGMDMAYVRYARERQYVNWLDRLNIEKILDEDGERVNPRLLGLEVPIVRAGRNSIPYSTRSTSLSVDEVMPLADREFERKVRHRTGCLIPAHCQEAAVITVEAAPLRYPAASERWKDREEPYGGRTELPPVVTYFGTKLIDDPESPYTWVLYTELAALRMAELLHRARNGQLWWTPPAIIDDILEVTLEEILRGTSAQCVEDAGRLIDYIRDIDWGKVPKVNRQAPNHPGLLTPVFESGDWVKFDPDLWKPTIPDDWWFPEETAEGVDHLSTRGARLSTAIRINNNTRRENEEGFSRKFERKLNAGMRSYLDNHPHFVELLSKEGWDGKTNFLSVLKACEDALKSKSALPEPSAVIESEVVALTATVSAANKETVGESVPTGT